MEQQVGGCFVCTSEDCEEREPAKDEDTPVMCGWCDEDNVVYVKCRECGVWLCDGCRAVHKQLKAMRSHALFTAQQVEAGELQEDFKPCQRHSGKLLELFCNHCLELCCVTGRATIHGLHECITLEERLKGFQQSLASQIEGLQMVREEINITGGGWTDCIRRKENNTEDVIKEVIKRKNKLVSMVEKKAAGILREILKDASQLKENSTIVREEIADALQKLDAIQEEYAKVQKNESTPGELYEKQNSFAKMLENAREIMHITPASWNEFVIEVKCERDNLGCVIEEFLGSLKAKQKPVELTKPELIREIDAKTNSDQKSPRLWDVAILPDGNIAATDYISGNNKIKVWDPLTGDLLRESKDGQFPNASSIVPIPGDPDVLLVSNWTRSPALQEWNSKTGEVATVILSNLLPSDICGVSVGSFGGQEVLLLANHRPPGIHLVHPGTKEPIKHYPMSSSSEYVAGHVSHTTVAVNFNCKNVNIFQQGELVGKTEKGVSRPYGLCMTSQGQVLVADHESHQVLLYSPQGQLIKTLLNDKDGISRPTGVDYSEQYQLLVIAEFNGKIKVFSSVDLSDR